MKKKELLHEQTNASTADNSSYSNNSQDDTCFEFVDKTPFAIMKVNGLWNITMGNYIVKEGIESKEKAIQLIRIKDWQVLLVASAIYQEMIKDIEKRKKEQENTNN
jgi:nitrogen regulatory protein PII-like uncharacterized protein